jgi:hypothetical protein
MAPRQSTDVWFRTALSLRELADALGARVLSADAENHWEWLIADFAGVQLDLTRTHTVPAAQTDTRIFLWGGHTRGFPQPALDRLVTELRRIRIDPVYVGAWLYRSGEEFDLVVHDEITGPPA